MESLKENRNQTEIPTKSQQKKSVFIEVAEQSGNDQKESDSGGNEIIVNNYEDFWVNDEFDDTIEQVNKQPLEPPISKYKFIEFTEHSDDNIIESGSNASEVSVNNFEEFVDDKEFDYFKVEDDKDNVQYFSEFGSLDLIDQRQKSQPLTILKSEIIINEITTPDDVKKDPNVSVEVNS